MERAARGFARLAAGLGVLWAVGAVADDTTFPWSRVVGAATSSLTQEQQDRVVALAGTTANYHGCRGTVAECIAKDPVDATAARLAGFLVRRVVAGDTDARIAEGVADRRRSARPARTAEIDLFEANCVGPANAEVTIVEFGDFQCPFCRAAEPFLERIVAAHVADVRLCFKHFPVRSHDRAVPSSVAALAAARQGKYWEMHRALYLASDLSDANLEAVARQVGLDLARYRADIADEALREEVETDKLEGQELGVDRTPTLFVNGKQYYGPLTEVELADRIAEELAMR
jgi:protein-disulfide isomerase